jgi:hypothetical protein
MKRWWSVFLLMVAACVAAPPPSGSNSVAPTPIAATANLEVTLNNYGPAPELTNTNWLNTGGQVLRLADLRGRVVAIDMWTFG